MFLPPLKSEAHAVRALKRKNSLKGRFCKERVALASMMNLFAGAERVQGAPRNDGNAFQEPFKNL